MSTPAVLLVVVLLVAMVIGLPVAWSLGLAGLAAVLTDGTLPMMVIAQRPFAAIDSFPMLAIPGFIVAGEIMSAGGISKRLVNFCQAMLGRIPGSLSVVSVVACAFFAALSGSAIATTAAIGGIIYPEMVKRGYPKDYSAAVQAIGGTLGPVIPPSLLFIFYAQVTNLSVAKLLMSGVIPGILSAAGLCLVAIIIAKKNNYPVEGRTSGQEKISAFKDAIWALLFPIIILGGIYSGIFTPTEAALVAVVYGLLVSLFIYRELKVKDILKIFKNAAVSTANTLVLVSLAQMFAWMVAYYNIPTLVTNAMTSVIDNKVTFLLICNVVLIIAGMFMDAIPIIVIMAPILHPMALAYNINPIQFALVVTFILCLGIATPPFGPTLYVACGFSQEPLMRVAKKMMPFVAMQIALGLLFSFVPALSTWLPSLL